MQNKVLGLMVLVLGITGTWSTMALAQEPAADKPAVIVDQPADVKPVADQASAKRPDSVATEQALQPATEKTPSPNNTESASSGETPMAMPVLNDMVLPPPPAVNTPDGSLAPATLGTDDAVQAENKKRLEEELKNTTVAGKAIVDFPNRPSLGTLELAPLPGANETTISGPSPMAQSVSGKDLPSEQLLGRITPEVFQEMADLERGNTFLKLQLEKERLKNDLEKLKSTYREQRLNEIAKREDVVRSRIQWWQEQERLRLEIEKKQAEEAELARKAAEQEATLNQAREEAMKRLGQPVASADKNAAAPVADVVPQTMEELYTLDSIRGTGKNLTARLKSKADGMEWVVKKDDILPSGHVVKEIKKDMITVAYGKRIDQLVFRPAMAQ